MKQAVLDPRERCRYDEPITYTPENTMYVDLEGVKPTGSLGGLSHWDAEILLKAGFPGTIPLDHTVTDEGVLRITIRFTGDGDALVDVSVYPRRGFPSGEEHVGWEKLSLLSGIRVRDGRLYYVYRGGGEEEKLEFIKPELVYGYNRLLATICVRNNAEITPFTGKITITYDDTPPPRFPSIEYVGLRLATVDSCRLAGDYWLCRGYSGGLRIPVHIVFSGKASKGFPVRIMVFRDEGWRPGMGAYSTVKPVLVSEETVEVPAGSDMLDTHVSVGEKTSPLVVFASYLWWDNTAWGRWSTHVVFTGEEKTPVVGNIYGDVFNTLMIRCCGRLVIGGDYPYVIYRLVSSSTDTGYVKASGTVSTTCSGLSTLQLYVPLESSSLYIESCGEKMLYRVVSGRSKPYLYDLSLVRGSSGYVLEIAYGSKVPSDTYAVIDTWVDEKYLGRKKILVPSGSLIVYHSIGYVSGNVKICVTSTGKTLCLEKNIVSGKPVPPRHGAGAKPGMTVPVIPLPKIPSMPRNTPQKEFLVRTALLVLGSSALLIPLAEVINDHD